MMNPVETFFVQWAQDEFWIGHMLSKKVYDYGPDLEENISIGSISQDEMGHCRLLLRTITTDEKQMDHFLYGLPPEQQRVSLLAESWHHNNWSTIVVKQLLYDYADQIRIRFCRKIADEQIQKGLEVIEREEQIHREHWLEWAKLLSESPIGQKEMQEAVNRLYPLLTDFFVDPLYAEIARLHGFAAERPEELLVELLDRVDPLLSRFHLNVPLTRAEMMKGFEKKGSRYGHHSADFEKYFEEVTEVYRKYPNVIWS